MVEDIYWRGSWWPSEWGSTEAECGKSLENERGDLGCFAVVFFYDDAEMTAWAEWSKRKWLPCSGCFFCFAKHDSGNCALVFADRWSICLLINLLLKQSVVEWVRYHLEDELWFCVGLRMCVGEGSGWWKCSPWAALGPGTPRARLGVSTQQDLGLSAITAGLLVVVFSL